MKLFGQNKCNLSIVEQKFNIKVNKPINKFPEKKLVSRIEDNTRIK